MKFYIVSPHSFCCKKNKVRHCDRVAKYYAEKINDYLLSAGHEVIMQLSDHLRFGDCKNDESDSNFKCDYNRDTTLNLEWRKQMMTSIEKFNPDFVFEVHSYPGDMEDYFYLWRKFRVKCLKSKFNTPFIAELVDNIGDIENDKVGIASPDFEPSITYQIGDKYKHTLFEFNELFKDEETAIKVAEGVIKICNDQYSNKIRGGAPNRKKGYKNIKIFMICIFLFIVFVVIYLAIETASASRFST